MDTVYYFVFIIGPLCAANSSDFLSEMESSTKSYTDINYFQPEQIHLSLGESTSEIVVTWQTWNDTDSVVEYGIEGMVLKAAGKSTLFVDGGKLKKKRYTHRVTLPDLLPRQRYVYHCGSDYGWSPEFYFDTLPTDSDWSPRLAVYGDLGNENPQSLPRLQQETQRGMYDAFLHIGDFAYDMRDNDGDVGDEFMRQIEPIAAYVPYMVCPGNHEEAYNFSHYKNRFSMPRSSDNMMYSFDLGPAHFISFSTEVYYFLEYGIKPMVFQYQWLENDLKEATKPENRAQRPWIITYGHRPMYCSNNDSMDNCLNQESLVRSGTMFFNWFGLEDLFYKYGVDLELWAHEHSYERFWPLYNYTVHNGSYSEPYHNPKAPVHIITGSAGCKENNSHFYPNPPPWSAIQSTDYGYTRMTVYNRTHLYMEQVSDDLNGAVIDRMWLKKDKHESYS